MHLTTSTLRCVCSSKLSYRPSSSYRSLISFSKLAPRRRPGTAGIKCAASPQLMQLAGNCKRLCGDSLVRPYGGIFLQDSALARQKTTRYTAPAMYTLRTAIKARFAKTTILRVKRVAPARQDSPEALRPPYTNNSHIESGTRAKVMLECNNSIALRTQCVSVSGQECSTFCRFFVKNLKHENRTKQPLPNPMPPS